MYRCFVFLTNDLINLNDTKYTTVFVYRQTWIILNLAIRYLIFFELGYKINSINISSVAPPWSNIWPITWWTADICVFLFLSSNATATASLFSVGWFITHAKVSSKRGAYSWQSLMILLKDNDSRFFGEMLRSTDLFFTWQRVLH